MANRIVFTSNNEKLIANMLSFKSVYYQQYCFDY